MGLRTRQAAQASRETLGVEHVYAFVLGDGVPHLHVHVIGRNPGPPRSYWGPRVDEWPDAPRGDEDEIAALAERLRVYLRKPYGS